MDVLSADAGRGLPDRLVREHRRALLRELEEEDARDRAPGAPTAEEAPYPPGDRQQKADGNADPPVDPLEKARLAAESFQIRAGFRTDLTTLRPPCEASEMADAKILRPPGAPAGIRKWWST